MTALEEYLEHSGVKGMKWGRRRDARAVKSIKSSTASAKDNNYDRETAEANWNRQKNNAGSSTAERLMSVKKIKAGQQRHEAIRDSAEFKNAMSSYDTSRAQGKINKVSKRINKRDSKLNSKLEKATKRGNSKKVAELMANKKTLDAYHNSLRSKLSKLSENNSKVAKAEASKYSSAKKAIGKYTSGDKAIDTGAKISREADKRKAKEKQYTDAELDDILKKELQRQGTW